MKTSDLLIEIQNGIYIVKFLRSNINTLGPIADLEKHISQIVESNVKPKIIISLDNVELLTSMILGKLLHFHKLVLKYNGSIWITDLNKNVMELFKITKMNQVLNIADQLKVALNVLTNA